MSIDGVVGEHPLAQVVDRLHVGEVGGVDVRRAAGGLDLRLASPRASPAPRATSSGMPPAAATFSAADLPMPLEAPVMTTVRPLTARAQRAVLEEVRVEVALPVVPELVGVARAAAGPRCRCPASACSVSRVSNEQLKPTCSTTSSGMSKSARIARRTSLSCGSCITIEQHALGQRVEAACGRSASRAAARARRGRSGSAPRRTGPSSRSARWNAWPSRPSLVGDVVHRGGDVVDRHEVRRAELGADQREPLRAARCARRWIALKK